jgi:Protein of unknown function (DUF4031)
VAVYVDDARIPADVRNGSRVHSSRWSHLTADTQAELHEFAARLGLRRSYFQPGKPRGDGSASPFWHYDLTEGKVRQALALGARQVSAGDMTALMRVRNEAAANMLTAGQAGRAAGQAWKDGDAAKALRFLAAARALAPGRAELWDQRERQVLAGPHRGPGRVRGCETPECGKPGRPYPAGDRCDEHKPRATWRRAEAQPAAGPAGTCPGCGKADLTYGRSTCQACGAAAAFHEREREAGREAGQ